MGELSNLANIGWAGVFIVMIGALVLIVRAFLKSNKEQTDGFVNFIGNHIESHTKANQRLADVVENLLRYLERLNDKK